MREKRSLFSHLQRQKICNKLAVYEVRDQLCVQAVWPQQAQGAFESLHGGGGTAAGRESLQDFSVGTGGRQPSRTLGSLQRETGGQAETRRRS